MFGDDPFSPRLFFSTFLNAEPYKKGVRQCLPSVDSDVAMCRTEAADLLIVWSFPGRSATYVSLVGYGGIMCKVESNKRGKRKEKSKFWDDFRNSQAHAYVPSNHVDLGNFVSPAICCTSRREPLPIV
jgi:hypothetical protein